MNLNVAGRHIFVREDGASDAPVLLFVHGFSGSLHWFDDVVSRLRDEYRIVRVDLLGHGSTGGAAADAPEQARMVDGVLDTLDLDDVTAVGHSFGADVVADLAEHSARVTRVAVLAQAPDYSDAKLPHGRAIMTIPVLSRALHRGAQPIVGALGKLAARRNSTAGRLAQQAAADFRALDTAMFHIVLIERRDRMARHPLDQQLRAAGKPALVVLAGRDHFYGARSAARYERAGARVEILPDSGHSVIIDEPARTAELLAAFARAT